MTVFDCSSAQRRVTGDRVAERVSRIERRFA